MSFATKADLKTQITAWLARSDLTSYYDDFITLAQARFSRIAQMRLYEANTTLTGVVDVSTLTLPTDYDSPVGLTILNPSAVQGAYWQVTPMTYDQLVVETYSAQPTAWAIDGALIQLNRPCDQAYTFNFRYYQDSYTLPTDTDTNALLTAAPDLYLAACMIEANIFAKDPQAAALWENKFNRAMGEVVRQANKSKAKAVLTSDLALLYSNSGYGSRGGNWFA